MFKIATLALSSPVLAAPKECDLADFTCHDQLSPYRYYKKGSGPAVIVLHELPGLCEQDIDLGRRLAKSSFTVYLPHFFGALGKEQTIRNLVRLSAFPSPFWTSIWLPWHTSGVAGWLEKLVAVAYRERREKGVGIIGMCLTGGLPLALLKLDPVRAAVLCQPTNPLFSGDALDIDKKDLAAAVTRIQRENIRVLGVKFSGDGKSPSRRYQTLESKLKGHFSEIIIQSGHQHWALRHVPHSVLGVDYAEPSNANFCTATHETFDRVRRYLNHRLRDQPAGEDFPAPGTCPSYSKCYDF